MTTLGRTSLESCRSPSELNLSLRRASRETFVPLGRLFLVLPAPKASKISGSKRFQTPRASLGRFPSKVSRCRSC